MIDDPTTFENLHAAGVERLLPGSIRITVGMGTCGTMTGARGIVSALRKARLEADVVEVGCEGLCWAEPLMGVADTAGRRFLYTPKDPDQAISIAAAHCSGEPADAIVVRKSLIALDHRGDVVEIDKTAARAACEQKLVSWRCGLITPWSAEEYIAAGGYRVLQGLISGALPTAEVLNVIESSGLRGCGGAGYPVASKWRALSETDDAVRRLIANGDEGDPGAYMDRSLMEGDPHALIEGMAIAALCLDIEEAFIVMRVEYERAFTIMQRALDEAVAIGMIGDSLSRCGRPLPIRIVRSGGAYLGGEETALISSLENGPGIPRKKPPYPSESGLWSHPTCINNVETLANVPVVVGTLCQEEEGCPSKGESLLTKLFCVTGAREKTGLAEVPLGTPLNRLVSHFAGNRCNEYKAVQIGGPSGSVLPVDFDVSLDFDSLRSQDFIMGSGGIVLLGNDDCIVEVARYFIDFSYSQSCKRCRACSNGLFECLHILEGIVGGAGSLEDIVRLEQLAKDIPRGSLCGLGQSATRGLASALRFFRHEFESHIEGSCLAKKCKALIRFEIEKSKCPGCLCCLTTCPSNAMQGKLGKPFAINQGLCQKCRMCLSICPYDAVRVVPV